MKLLRDKKRLTKFLILYTSALNKPNKLADIAEELEMTQQGVSNYISEMEEEGLIDTSGKRYHPTSEGIEMVRDILAELNIFIDEASHQIEFISKCTAIADESISKGDDVGLFMKNGFLHASLEESTSMGSALNDAGEGEPIEVGGLHGITEMQVGTIYLLVVDGTGELSSSKSELEEKIHGLDFDKLAVLGEFQYGVTNVLNIQPDIMFAPIESSLNAAEKGLNVLFIVSENDLDRLLEKIRGRNKDRDEEYRIKHQIVQ